MVLTRSHKLPTQADQTQNQKSASSKKLLKSGQEKIKNDHTETGVTLVPKPDCEAKHDTGAILPDSTTRQLEQNLGDEQKCQDAVTKTTNRPTPPTGNENTLTKSTKRRQRAKRSKRKMTSKSNSDDKTENSSPRKGMADPSVSSSVSPSKKKKPEKIADKKLEEQNKDKENNDADVGTEMTHDAQEMPQDVEKPAVNLEEVIQLYKKESYNAQGELARPKGKPKSGRFWKTEQMNRFSGMKQDRPLKTSWQKKMQQKAEMKNMKAFEAELKEAKNEELERKKKYRAKKLKQKQENQRKSEVVQVISNTAKIKRMKKKQLRKIEMRSLPDSSKKQVFPS